jgi:hypothetical protein
MAEPKGFAMAQTTKRGWRAQAVRPGLALALFAVASCTTAEFHTSTLVTNNGPTTTQTGEVTILRSASPTYEVFYPIAYQSPPNLRLTGDTDGVELIEQQADHFTVRRRTVTVPTIHWRAEGKPCYGPPPLKPVVIEAPPPPPDKLPPPRRVPDLPPEPIPVKGP